MIQECLLRNDKKAAKDLSRWFGFKKQLVYRAEQIFYNELVLRVPALKTMRRCLDESVLSGIAGMPKKMSDPRPDYFHFDDAARMAIHGEFDETDSHEDDDDRLYRIAHHAGIDRDRIYMFRVLARLDTPDALCDRVESKGYVYYKMNTRGLAVVDRVAEYVVGCIERIGMGMPPDTGKTYF
jgi:hypothetical protein